MEFNCSFKEDKEVESWTSSVREVHEHGSFFEIFISSRSSLRIIVGCGNWGNFVCVPDWNIGTHLSDFRDYFWNSEKLSDLLGKVDGITVATIIKEMADAIEHNYEDDSF